MKKIVSNFIENEIHNDISYNDIKDKIDVNQYLKENKIKKKINFKLASLICMIAVLLIGGLVMINMERVNFKDMEITLYENDKDWIDAHDYVFIAKVEKEIDTKKYDGTGTDIPYTFYQIEIIKYLKGEGESNGIICFYGGKEYLNTWTLYKSNDELPIISGVYLFFTNKKIENSVNTRINEENYIIARNDQKILFSDYNTSKDINEQNENIQLTIKRFTNVINKKTKFDIEIPTFNNTQEMVNSFDYIFIAKLDANYRTNETTTDIPNVIYDYSSIASFKYNLLFPLQISFYGVNYWYDDETSQDGLKIPENDGVYLILANVNPNNSNELLILANYQYIKLEGYNINLSYIDQSEEIKTVVDEYISLIANIDDKYK